MGKAPPQTRLSRDADESCVFEMLPSGKGFTITETVKGKRTVQTEEYFSSLSAEAALKMLIDERVLDHGWFREAGKRRVTKGAPAVGPPIDLRGWFDGLSPPWKRAVTKSLGLGRKATDGQLGRIGTVKELSLCEAGLRDLSPLAKLVSLEELDLYDNPFDDLAPLTKLVNPRSLSIANCTEVTRLLPLTKLAKLTVLDVSSTSVADLRPLAKITTLAELTLAGLDTMPRFLAQVASVRKALPHCRVSTTE